MTRDFFDPKLEYQIIILVERAQLEEAESLIQGLRILRLSRIRPPTSATLKSIRIREEAETLLGVI